MNNRKQAVAQGIDALSVSAEFLLCAIRELATGSDPSDREVSDPIAWAVSKLKEAQSVLKLVD